jgi:peptidoglycan/xylan/chitin deacetylase (PgdA/CDA1 family)
MLPKVHSDVENWIRSLNPEQHSVGFSQQAKRWIYQAAKKSGMFQIARTLTRNALRIICYHGFCDEPMFDPQTFMRGSSFAKRMDHLVLANYPVLGLSEALDRLAQGTLPPAPVVITFDDGFHSTWQVAWPSLLKNGFSATLYVTTYYALMNSPVFRLAVQYLFYKTREKQVNISTFGLSDEGRVDISTAKSRHKLMWRIIDEAERKVDEQSRQELAHRLGDALGVSFERLKTSRLLSLMTPDEIRAADRAGFNVQLHTHRHRFPKDEKLATQEIFDNQHYLGQWLGKTLDHFCFPSGLWEEEHMKVLQGAGIRSAVTCDSGLNYLKTPSFLLRRFLDGENLSQIEFEAEVSGFAQLFRTTLKRMPDLYADRQGRSLS